jgi:hypothetical protein
MHPRGSADMMRSVLALMVIGLQLSGIAAHAVQITNRDEADHKVTVIEGSAKTDHVLKPSQALNGICAKGCIVRLNDSEDDEYQLEVDDVVSIEDGSLYYEEAAAGQRPAGGEKPAAGSK